jgi:hypothetical protein
MKAPISIAMVALIYQTLKRDRYGGPASLFDELSSNMGDGPDDSRSSGRANINLLGMVASQSLEDIDWELIDLMPDHDNERVDVRRFGRVMAAFDPTRCEAFLHAVYEDPPAQLTSQKWARPFLKRWDLVHETKQQLEPLTWDREKMEEVALGALEEHGAEWLEQVAPGNYRWWNQSGEGDAA